MLIGFTLLKKKDIIIFTNNNIGHVMGHVMDCSPDDDNNVVIWVLWVHKPKSNFVKFSR